MRYIQFSLLIFIVGGLSVHAEILEIGSQETYTSINAALAAADPYDTLLIHWESGNPEYNEHVQITKIITLTSDWTPGSDPMNRPVIQCSLSTYDEVVSIEVDNVTVSNLRIKTSVSIPAVSGDDINMTGGHQAGVRVKNDNCTVSCCEVTRCRIGVYLDSTINVSIDSCTIGRLTSVRWEPPVSVTHDGNFFGIVQLEPSRSTAAFPVGEYKSNRITNCTIARNRFYGVVLRGGSMATVQNNLIVWNGTNAEFSSANHWGDGGILCLFTSDEMSGTDVELQSPMITSNTIYGNDGFQVCVITDDPGREPRDIANAPVLMSNIIGPDTLTYDTGSPTPIPTSAPNWLVSCTSESSYAAMTPQHGSAPIMAFNNLYRPGATGADTMYFAHPGNPTSTPGAPTSTPTPTQTPTPTGTQYTPVYAFNTPSSYSTPTIAPTYTPWPTPAPTSPPGSPTFTPTAAPFKMDASTWSTKNGFGDPRFVGGDTVEDFDFHLKDPVFQMTPTPNDPRSAAYDTSGFRLNPGITQSNQSPDIGQVDIGAHYPSNVPAVSNVSCAPYGQYGATVTWNNPERYPDDSLFSDLAGNIFYFGHRNQSRIVSIVSRVYLEPMETYTFTSPPTLDTNVLGVAVYNTSGTNSSTVWVDMCN